MTPYERETSIVTSDGDTVVHIFTAQQKYIRKLRSTPGVTETQAGTSDGCEFAHFTVPAANWNPVSGVKRTRAMSPEARAAAAERLRQSRIMKASD